MIDRSNRDFASLAFELYVDILSLLEPLDILSLRRASTP